MSETGEDAIFTPGAGHGTMTDPRGLVGAGTLPDSHVSTGATVRTTADMSDEERAYNRELYGLTHHERNKQRGTACVTHCIAPGQRRRGVRCPACYGPIEIRAFLEDTDIEPGQTRADRFAAWVGGWVGAFLEAVMFPFRVGRAHHEAMTRDILRDALINGLEIEEMADIVTYLQGIEQQLRTISDQLPTQGEA